MSTIKYKTYQKALSYIAYWILTNKKKVTECEVYSYNNKGYKLATVKKKILEGKGKNIGYGMLYMEFAINNGRSYEDFPNYVSIGKTKYYKDTYTDMAKRVIAFRKKYNRNPSTVAVQGTNKTNTTSKTNSIILNKFIEAFGELTYIDSVLKKIKGRGYKYYYNSIYNNSTTLKRIKNKQGVNCTDSSQLIRAIALALGYQVQFIHVQCSSGGHIRLRLKHKKNTGGKWIYRDPACVLSDNGKGITCNWCMDGKIIAYDPSWLLADAME